MYIRYIHTIIMLTMSNKFVVGRDIPSVGDFILKYSENFDYIKVRKGAPIKTCSKSSLFHAIFAHRRSSGTPTYTSLAADARSECADCP